MQNIKSNKKIRTRQHVIADLSANHLEFYSLLNNFSIEEFIKDYGYDVNLYTYDENGEIENGCIYIQLKATDSIKYIDKGSYVSFSIDKRDLNLWLEEPMPCILLVYDALKMNAYWIYIQSYFNNLDSFNINDVNKYINVQIPTINKINKVAIKRFREFKENILYQIKGYIKHNE